MTEKQKAIYQYLAQNGETKKSILVQKFGHWYYTNSAFHLGNLLHTMIKQGFIMRVKTGVYAVGKTPQVVTSDPNQKSLF
jgi:glucan-binding YG repeat protein